MKVIFLDFDGVLNSERYISDNYNKSFDGEGTDYFLRDLDKEKILLVKKICDETGAKVVVSSSWRKLGNYLSVERWLIDMGLPIIGRTGDAKNGSRGAEIKKYLEENPDVQEYIILDDVVFIDFGEELLNHLIRTSFYEDGLEEKHVEEAIYKLGLKQ